MATNTYLEMKYREVGAHDDQGLVQVAGLVVYLCGAEGGDVELLEVGDPVLAAGVEGRVILVPVADGVK
jgi:hypothetical protein